MSSHQKGLHLNLMPRNYRCTDGCGLCWDLFDTSNIWSVGTICRYFDVSLFLSDTVGYNGSYVGKAAYFNDKKVKYILHEKKQQSSWN